MTLTPLAIANYNEIGAVFEGLMGPR